MVALHPRLAQSAGAVVCAGGDIKALRQAVISNGFMGYAPSGHTVREIFLAEFRLVRALAALTKPAVALCNGVWMGFGVGLSGFLSIRVITEKTKFAMPECSIGVHSPCLAFGIVGDLARRRTGHKEAIKEGAPRQSL
jgi:enoyl-CoA hydratase/carnithine racemase